MAFKVLSAPLKPLGLPCEQELTRSVLFGNQYLLHEFIDPPRRVHGGNAIKTIVPENKENTGIQLSTRAVYGSSPVNGHKSEEPVISQMSFRNDFFPASPF